ncbi:wax ester synthase/diacylglycerol acyltransferase 6-like [Wolffia australiana]
MDDIKAVKNKMNATINDVMLGIITSGLAKYFKIMSPKDKRNKFRITGLSMVDIRRTPGIQDFFSKIKDGTAEWGNRFGYVILPLCFDRSISNSLEYVKQAKAILGQKKQSLEAKFTYHGGSLIMSFLGLKLASKLNYRVVCNTSFSFSNVVGPSEMIMFAKNPILSLRVTTTTLPHAFISHFISYNGKASMQLMVTKDIIHDPEILAKCFCDSLNEMKSSCDTQ